GRGAGILHAALPDEAPHQRENARFPEAVAILARCVEEEAAVVRVRGLVDDERVRVVPEAAPEVSSDGLRRDVRVVVLSDVAIERPRKELQQRNLARRREKAPAAGGPNRLRSVLRFLLPDLLLPGLLEAQREARLRSRLRGVFHERDPVEHREPPGTFVLRSPRTLVLRSPRSVVLGRERTSQERQ